MYICVCIYIYIYIYIFIIHAYMHTYSKLRPCYPMACNHAMQCAVSIIYIYIYISISRPRGDSKFFFLLVAWAAISVSQF